MFKKYFEKNYDEVIDTYDENNIKFNENIKNATSNSDENLLDGLESQVLLKYNDPENQNTLNSDVRRNFESEANSTLRKGSWDINNVHISNFRSGSNNNLRQTQSPSYNQYGGFQYKFMGNERMVRAS